MDEQEQDAEFPVREQEASVSPPAVQSPSSSHRSTQNQKQTINENIFDQNTPNFDHLIFQLAHKIMKPL